MKIDRQTDAFRMLVAFIVSAVLGLGSWYLLHGATSSRHSGSQNTPTQPSPSQAAVGTVNSTVPNLAIESLTLPSQGSPQNLPVTVPPASPSSPQLSLDPTGQNTAPGTVAFTVPRIDLPSSLPETPGPQSAVQPNPQSVVPPAPSQTKRPNSQEPGSAGLAQPAELLPNLPDPLSRFDSPPAPQRASAFSQQGAVQRQNKTYSSDNTVPKVKPSTFSDVPLLKSPEPSIPESPETTGNP